MKKLIFSAFAMVILSQAAFAMPPKPEKCPGVESLQTSAFELAQQDRDGTWVAGVLHHNYDTNNAWTFAIGKIHADDADDAMQQAQESLNSLSFYKGPIPMTQYNVWACAYFTAEGFPGVAVTPALGLTNTVNLLK